MNNLSEHSFVAPYRFIGAAALSVLSSGGAVDNLPRCLVSSETETEICSRLVDAGARDGISKKQELSIDEPIVFDTHSVLFGDCMHNANSPDIWLWKPGNYMVNVGICPNDQCQFSIIKNTSFIIPGGTFGINSSMSAQANITFIMLLEDTDFTEFMPNSNNTYGCRIQVVNTSSLTETVTLYNSI